MYTTACSRGESVNMGRLEATMTVEAELRVPTATVQLVNVQFSEPSSGQMREVEDYRLDLCLTPRPRNARVCYSDRWAPHRFEPLGPVWLAAPGARVAARPGRGRRPRAPG